MRRWSLLLIGLGLAWAGPARAQSAGGLYRNDRWGYRIRPPADFKNAALSADEEWIASKHIAERALQAKRSEFYASDYPQVWVIGFPHQRQDEQGAKVEQTEKGVTISFKNPYKDYKDFVKRERWFVGGGYYFSKEKETTWKGMKVTQYEIKVEKMVAAPYRIVTWVYHFDDIDFAVQCKILEDYWKKYRPAYTTCLRSFRRIERKRALPGTSSTGEKIVQIEDESKMSREDKAQSRRDRFENKLQREVEHLPKGWKVDRTDHYVALYNCSTKYCKAVLNHAEAIRGYLDKELGGVGDDYVPPGMIRIFASDAERAAYTKSSGTVWFTLGGGDEIVLSEQSSREGLKTWAMESVSENVASQWLSFRNKLLYQNLPWWFRFGLEQHMKFVRVKGKSVRVKPDAWDRDYIRQIIKQGKAVPIKTLFERGDDQSAYTYQTGSVISYLMTKGDRGKFRGCIRKYLENMILAIDEAQAEYDKERDRLKAEQEARESENAGIERAESEDEESAENEDEESEQYWEKLREAMKKKEEAIRARAFEATFGHLSDKDWQRLDRAWLSHAK